MTLEKTAIGCYIDDINSMVAKTDKEKLIKQHLPYAISIAKKYAGQGLSLEDLIAEANVGLMKAAEKFDPESGNSFTTYSVHWIRQSIMMALSNNRLVRLPLNKIYDVKKATGTYGRERNLELDRPVLGDEDDRTIGDFMPAEDQVIKRDTLEENQLKVSNLLGKLSPRDQEVIKMYYGVGYDFAVGSDVIANRFEMTSTRVNQIVRNGIKKMAQC